MTTNSTEYLTSIGLDSVYVAEILQDDANAFVADTPVYLAPVAELSGQPKLNEEILYYDDMPYEVLASEGITERKLKISALPPEIEALLTGEVFDAVSGRLYDSADPASAPYFALGYRAKKSNGSYRYYWFLKGRFQKPGAEHTTVGEKAEGKPIELMYSAQKTIYKFDQGSRTDGIKRVMGDDDTTDFDPTGWFAAVQTPEVVSASALTCTPSPADGATSVSTTATITLTFNNAIRTGNVGILLTKNDGVVVAITPSWDADNKVVTLAHSALAAATKHLITLSGVTDIYGQTLANTVYDFTTA
jgi:phi13 family phage major tail protein